MKKYLFILFITALTLSLYSLGTLRVESIRELPATHTNLEVYDADGKYAPVLIIKTELEGLGIDNVGRPTKHPVEYHEFGSGKHEYPWNAYKRGSGLYIYQLKTERYTKNMKMLLLK